MGIKGLVAFSAMFASLFSPCLLIAGETTQTVWFSSTDISHSRLADYDLLTIPGCELSEGFGKPQLPARLVRVALPPGATMESVDLRAMETDTLPGRYLIYPSQPPQPFSRSAQDIQFTHPDQSIYSSLRPYPETVAELCGTGHFGGQKIVSILLYPLRYIPAERTLLFHRFIQFSVRYKEGGEPPSPLRPMAEHALRVYRKLGTNLVSNPEELRRGTGPPPPLPPNDYEYVIITTSSLAYEFQRLADWKTRKGVPAAVALTDSIYSSCPGLDNAEKVRNFIKDAHSAWGTSWVLLGGDPALVPDRIAYAMTCGYGGAPDEDSIRCDLYFSDLDGTWDLDGDRVYGEVEDSVDMYPDVFVGRATVGNPSEAQVFVDKVLAYERNPPLDYQLKMLFAAEVMWSDPYTDGGVAKNLIDDKWVPPRFDPILKLYQSLGNENRQSVMAAINDGQSVVNHNGHAWISIISVGDGYLSNYDMLDSLHNSPRFSVLFSIGCWPAAFDRDSCLGKCFIISPQGGGIAFIGNSRYGWGSPGNPEYGYSDRFDQQFFRALFEDEVENIGAALADAKAYYVSRSGQENVYRWCEYQVNLLGDPELVVWTDLPRLPGVEHSDTVPMGASPLTVRVRVDGAPVEGALICVTKGSEVYERGLSGPDGHLELNVAPSSPGSLLVTATAPNLLPYQGYAEVLADGPWVGHFDHSIVDSPPIGNGDGLLNPGETVTMPVTLKNYGTQPSYGVAAALRSGDSSVTIIDGLDLYGDIAAGDTCPSPDGFDFSVSPDGQNGDVVCFTLEITDQGGHSWSGLLSTVLAAPMVSYESYSVDDSWGNGNGVPEPGEHVTLGVTLKNSGLGLAQGVTGLLAAVSPHISLTGGGFDFGDIEPDSTGSDTFGVDISASCPLPHFPRLYLEIQTNDGYDFADDFLITIGETGFWDNMERGVGGWSHGGIDDLWHLSSHRSHSSSYSWYCGNESSWVYNNNMECWLLSPPFALAPQSRLTFWRWFDVAVYGITGLHVELIHGSGVDTLDFIGSGGALDSLYVGDDWFAESYDLSSYPVGDTVRVRFSFRSDEEPVAEGVFIDDFCCRGIGGVTAVEEREKAAMLPTRFLLAQNQPNPFTRTTSIAYHIPDCGSPVHTTLRLWDVAGRLVKTLVDAPRQGGCYSVRWDGKDGAGRNAAGGVYFYSLSAEQQGGGRSSEARRFFGANKMILLK